MSLIEDAQELRDIQIETLTASRTIVCAVCFRKPHVPGCPVLSLPRIVAALEAAERVRSAYEEARIIFGAPLGYRFHAALEKLDEALKV